MSENSIRYALDRIDVLQDGGRAWILVKGWAGLPVFDPALLRMKADGQWLSGQTLSIHRPDVPAAYPDENITADCGYLMKMQASLHPSLVQIYYGEERILEIGPQQIEQASVNGRLILKMESLWKDGDRLFGTGWMYSCLEGPLFPSLQHLTSITRKNEPVYESVPNVRMHLFDRRDIEDRYAGSVGEGMGFSFQILHPERAPLRLCLSGKNGQAFVDIDIPADIEEKLPAPEPKGMFSFLKRKKEEPVFAWRKQPEAKIREEKQPAPSQSQIVRKPDYDGSQPLDRMYYHDWFLHQRITEDELEKQCQTVFAKRPKISLLVASCSPRLDYFQEMVQSVQNQSYDNWQLCIADASDNDAPLSWLESLDDSRIVYKKLDGNLGISENTMEAYRLSDGDYIALYDHDDFLEPDALFEAVKALQEKDWALMYSDEDRYDSARDEFVGPALKPDYSPDLLLAHNYITHLLFVRRDLFEACGGLRKQFDGAQDHDLTLRACHKAGKDNIYHIGRILYHWRMHEQSTAQNASAKSWAYQAGEKALEEFIAKTNPGAKIEPTRWPGWRHISNPPLRQKHKKISVCALVHAPVFGQSAQQLVQSLLSQKEADMRLYIVTPQPETSDAQGLWSRLKKNRQVVLIPADKPLLASQAWNLAARQAAGDYLMMVTEGAHALQDNLVLELAGLAAQKQAGLAAPVILRPDKTIASHGISWDAQGHLVPLFGGQEMDPSYSWKVQTRNVSIVDSSCALCRRDVFEQAGGLDETLDGPYAMADLSLRLDQSGLFNIQTPFVQVIDAGVLARGWNGSQQEKLESDRLLFAKRWKEVLNKADPYSNPSFSRQNGALLLKADGE